MISSAAAYSSFPAHLYVEPTTLCNFSCRMCVKQAPGNEIAEGMLSPELFKKMIPALRRSQSVIFSGIGEPLLHPNLEHLIGLAKRYAPEDCRIGIQTNGHLLDRGRIQTILNSGINVICLSLDTVSAKSFNEIRSGGDLSKVDHAVKHLSSQRSHESNFNFGVEVVLMKKNLTELPEIVTWAAENGATFVIVTHLLPYRKELEAETVNSPNLNVSRKLYQTYKAGCRNHDLDLDAYLTKRWKYHFKQNKNRDERYLAQWGTRMIEEAYSNNIPLHFQNLITEDQSTLDKAEAVFSKTRDIADKAGLALTLPGLFPKFERRCRFIEERSLFLAWDGHVYPCYFLWHQYKFYQNGAQLKVTACPIGNLHCQTVDEIWSGEGVAFCEQVLKYNYPHCGNCNLGPCSLFTAKSFEYDCYAVEVPCGICPWCGGLLNCLR